jgi:hypothetical protein
MHLICSFLLLETHAKIPEGAKAAATTIRLRLPLYFPELLEQFKVNALISNTGMSERGLTKKDCPWHLFELLKRLSLKGCLQLVAVQARQFYKY